MKRRSFAEKYTFCTTFSCRAQRNTIVHAGKDSLCHNKAADGIDHKRTCTDDDNSDTVFHLRNAIALFQAYSLPRTAPSSCASMIFQVHRSRHRQTNQRPVQSRSIRRTLSFGYSPVTFKIKQVFRHQFRRTTNREPMTTAISTSLPLRFENPCQARLNDQSALC